MAESKSEEKRERVQKTLELKVNLSKEDLRRETLAEEEYLVSPIVILVEGVHNGIYYPAYTVIQRAVQWNNTPLSIEHPLSNGAPISMNTPEQIVNACGYIFNSEGLDTKLIGEAWINIKKTEEKSPGLIKRIESGEDIDVSCSVYCDLDMWEGEWNGKEYTSTVYDISADHVALLPDSIGACSFEDGCGLRSNEEAEEMPIKKSALKLIYNSIAEFLSIKTKEKSDEEEIMDLKSILAFIDNEDNKEVKAELMKTLSACEGTTAAKTETTETIDKTETPDMKSLSVEDYIEGIPCEETKTFIQEKLKANTEARKATIETLMKNMGLEEADLSILSTKVLDKMLEKFKTNDFSVNAKSSADGKEDNPVTPGIML